MKDPGSPSKAFKIISMPEKGQVQTCYSKNSSSTSSTCCAPSALNSGMKKFASLKKSQTSSRKRNPNWKPFNPIVVIGRKPVRKQILSTNPRVTSSTQILVAPTRLLRLVQPYAWSKIRPWLLCSVEDTDSPCTMGGSLSIGRAKYSVRLLISYGMEKFPCLRVRSRRVPSMRRWTIGKYP